MPPKSYKFVSNQEQVYNLTYALPIEGPLFASSNTELNESHCCSSPPFNIAHNLQCKYHLLTLYYCFSRNHMNYLQALVLVEVNPY